MANPQKEHGHTQIANELMEQIPMFKFNGTQLRILLVIIRYTYGFNRTEHEMSLSFISEATQINREQTKRELSTLIKNNVITVTIEASFNSTRVLKFNKNYEEWEIEKSKLKSYQGANYTPGSKKGYTPGSELDPTLKKEKNSYKHSSTKDGEGIHNIPLGGSGLDPQERQYKYNIKEKSINDFFESIWKLYPLKKGKNKVSNSSKKELHKIGYEEIARAIERYKKYVEANSWLKYQYGSTFLNGGYIDYLDANYKVEEQSETWGWDR